MNINTINVTTHIEHRIVSDAIDTFNRLKRFYNVHVHPTMRRMTARAVFSGTAQHYVGDIAKTVAALLRIDDASLLETYNVAMMTGTIDGTPVSLTVSRNKGAIPNFSVELMPRVDTYEV